MEEREFEEFETEVKGVPFWYGFSLMDNPKDDPKDVADVKEISRPRSDD